MTLSLCDLSACFDGVIPSLVATADAAGRPNVSYLSQVVAVDDAHVALSNQFFGKTAANIRANPNATLLLVDGLSGEQYQLDVRFRETLLAGAIFDRLAARLEAVREESGPNSVMRLRGVDIYRVEAIHHVPSPVEAVPGPAGPRRSFAALAEQVARIADQTDLEAIIETALAVLAKDHGLEHVLVLLRDPGRGVLTTIGSLGYERSGIGSEVAIGERPIGVAAQSGLVVRIADLSRERRFGAAVRASSHDENRTREIAVPGLPDALSQIVVPLVWGGETRGVLFAESRRRLAFDADDEAILTVLARQIAAGIAAVEASSDGLGSPATARAPAATGRTFRVVHHHFDDSVFVDDEYVIKGVSGRLLVHMLGVVEREGRDEFTNRELRLADALKLPDVKDNLETRLLLLRRRLEEKALPLRLHRIERGRMRLVLDGRPRLTRL
jgi:adenylate cyclase